PPGVVTQVLGLEVRRVLRQQVVHRPELVLGTGCFRRLSRQLGVRMNLQQREVAEDEADTMLESPQQHLYRRVRLCAIRTLEVSVLDQDDAGAFRTEDVIGLVDGYGQSERFSLPVHGIRSLM